MTSKPVFHGSDIEKICSFYHLKKENIINFGANVNPLGLPKNVQKELALTPFSSFFLSGQRIFLTEKCPVPVL